MVEVKGQACNFRPVCRSKKGGPMARPDEVNEENEKSANEFFRPADDGQLDEFAAGTISRTKR